MTKIISNSMYGNKSCATIIGVERHGFIVSDDNVTFTVKKAFSCLIEPQVSDIVVLYKKDENSTFITDILERTNVGVMEIIAKDGLTLQTQNGDLNLSSSANISISADDTLNSFAYKANVVIDTVSFLTKVTTLKAQTLNVIASAYHGVIDHLHMKNESVVQHIEGHEELQCHSSRKIVKESDIYNVNESITVAKGQVKIDAEQINMG